MSGMNTGNMDLLTRTELWSSTLKETLKDKLMGMGYVDMLTEFPDGNTFTIPSIGEPQVDDFDEGGEIQFRPRDTGEFQFTIDTYLSSGESITEKAMQDSYYAERLLALYAPDQERKIMEKFETDMFAKPEAAASANSRELINAVAHRLAGGNAGLIEVADFAYARLALQKANVPMTNLVAIVDPSVEFTINTLSNLVSVADNPMWEGIVATGIGGGDTGMRFVKNVYGFDVYTSNYLPTVTDNALPERNGSDTVNFSSTNGVANYFFSAVGGDLLPWKAAWRQEPKIEYEYDMKTQKHYWATTARYGVAFYRPENMVSVVTNPSVA